MQQEPQQGQGSCPNAPFLPWLDPDGGLIMMPIEKWGPLGWSWLHSHAICYPENPDESDQLLMFNMFWAFVRNLPCYTCMEHATEYAQKYPPDFSGSQGFQTWAWHFHNAVNHRLGKPLVSNSEYLKIYSDEINSKYLNLMVAL